jgi:hypothetical protein
MIPSRSPATVILLCELIGLWIMAGSVAAQPPLGNGRIWIGPPANPERYYRFATDNGIPGTGRYAYFDYNWPSLRQALDEYGFFGRRYRARRGSTASAPLAPGPTIGEPAAPVPEEPTLLKPPRKVGE